MSTTELRKAAISERADWGGPVNARHYPRAAAIHLAVADWLDLVAEDCEYDDNPAYVEAATKIARAINGGAA